MLSDIQTVGYSHMIEILKRANPPHDWHVDKISMASNYREIQPAAVV